MRGAFGLIPPGTLQPEVLREMPGGMRTAELCKDGARLQDSFILGSTAGPWVQGVRHSTGDDTAQALPQIAFVETMVGTYMFWNEKFAWRGRTSPTKIRSMSCPAKKPSACSAPMRVSLTVARAVVPPQDNASLLQFCRVLIAFWASSSDTVV